MANATLFIGRDSTFTTDESYDKPSIQKRIQRAGDCDDADIVPTVTMHLQYCFFLFFSEASFE